MGEQPDYATLRRVAEAATPGPWTWEAYGDTTDPDDPPHQHILASGRSPASGQGVADTYHHAVIEKHFATMPPKWGDKANAEYIAAFNPSLVLSLLDEIDRLRAIEAAVLKGRQGGMRTSSFGYPLP